MKIINLKSAVLILGLFFMFFSCLAKQTIRIALGEDLLPWVLAEKNKGLLIDLLEQTLGNEYNLDFMYLPYNRRILAYKNGFADAVCNINNDIAKQMDLKGYLATLSYSLNDAAISLRKNNIKITNIADLKKYSVLAWKGAKEFLGTDYQNMVMHSSKYKETANQEIQVKKLFLDREQVVFMDLQIFKYYRKKCSAIKSIDTTQPIDVFVYGRIMYGFLFKEKAACDAFNRNYAKLKNKSRYGMNITNNNTQAKRE